MCDVAAFFDSIPWDLLTALARQASYDLSLLAIGLQVHLGARLVDGINRRCGRFNRSVRQSIVPSGTESVSLAKVFLLRPP